MHDAPRPHLGKLGGLVGDVRVTESLERGKGRASDPSWLSSRKLLLDPCSSDLSRKMERGRSVIIPDMRFSQLEAQGLFEPTDLSGPFLGRRFAPLGYLSVVRVLCLELGKGLLQHERFIILGCGVLLECPPMILPALDQVSGEAYCSSKSSAGKIFSTFYYR